MSQLFRASPISVPSRAASSPPAQPSPTHDSGDSRVPGQDASHDRAAAPLSYDASGLHTPAVRHGALRDRAFAPRPKPPPPLLSARALPASSFSSPWRPAGSGTPLAGSRRQRHCGTALVQHRSRPPPQMFLQTKKIIVFFLA